MSKGIGLKEFNSLEKSEQKKYTCEWECLCNECHEKWHYLDSVERQMKSQVTTNAVVGLGNACNPCVGTATTNANTQLSKQIKELKQCPKCKSGNVKSEPRYFKQK